MSLANAAADTPLHQTGSASIAADVRASSGHDLVISFVTDADGGSTILVPLFRHPRIGALEQAFSSAQLISAQVRISAPPTVTSIEAAWVPGRFATEQALTDAQAIALARTQRTYRREFASSTFPINGMSSDLPPDHSFGRELLLPSITNRTPQLFVRVAGGDQAIVVTELLVRFSGVPPQ